MTSVSVSGLAGPLTRRGTAAGALGTWVSGRHIAVAAAGRSTALVAVVSMPRSVVVDTAAAVMATAAFVVVAGRSIEVAVVVSKAHNCAVVASGVLGQCPSLPLFSSVCVSLSHTLSLPVSFSCSSFDASLAWVSDAKSPFTSAAFLVEFEL